MASFEKLIPEGDNRERSVCTECGYVAYENPKVVVGSVIGAGDSVLMCRRAIEPRLGFWTIPAGYLELGETLQEGAAREALEEAEAAIAIDGILGVFSIARIGQVQVIFRARFANPDAPAFAPVRKARRSGCLPGTTYRGTRSPSPRFTGPCMPGGTPGPGPWDSRPATRRTMSAACTCRLPG